MNVPKDCLYCNRLKKNSGNIICTSYIIVEHDGCVTKSGGCDVVAVSLRKRRALLIEVKCGRISGDDADKAKEQLKNCFDHYRGKLGGFAIIPILLREKGKRLEGPTREKLHRHLPRELKGLIVKESGEELSSV